MNYDRYMGGRGGGGVDPLWDDLYNSLGYLMSEAEAEVCLDGAWTVAHPATSAELQAARGLPITKLGEDSIGIFFDAVPGTIQQVESIPSGVDWGMRYPPLGITCIARAGCRRLPEGGYVWTAGHR